MSLEHQPLLSALQTEKNTDLGKCAKKVQILENHRKKDSIETGYHVTFIQLGVTLNEGLLFQKSRLSATTILEPL